MDIVPFEQLRITTMTLIITLNSNINTEAAFLLLPITRVNINQTRESSKCKLPHCEIPGSILSMRFRDNIRGIIRNNSKPFKNSVTIDISTSRKNINLKLSSGTMQMCGASSKEDGVEAATHIINHLQHIQLVIDKIQNNLTHALQIIKWIKDITIGEPIERITTGSRTIGRVTLSVRRKHMETSIARPMIEIPSHFDIDITRFLLSMVDDFIYHNDMCQKLDFVTNIKNVVDDNLDIGHVSEDTTEYDLIKQVAEAMVNYNYSLGFEVDRTKLNKYINTRDGFISRFDNALATSVTIELPYDPPADMAIKRRRNKIPHSTFLVYKSGSVTQSGPGGEIMRDAYYKFRTQIAELRPLIEYKQTV